MSNNNEYTEERVIDLYRKRDFHTWELIYIYEGKLGATCRQFRTLSEAVEWLTQLGIEDIVDVGLMDEGSWRRQ